MLKPKTGKPSLLSRVKSKTYTSPDGDWLTTEEEDTSYQLSKYFTKVGSLFNNDPMNVFKLARNMTKGEIDFIIALFDSAGSGYKTYIFNYDVSALDRSKKNAAYKAFNLLKSKGLVKRVRKAEYIINPALFIPLDEEAADDLWASLP